MKGIYKIDLYINGSGNKVTRMCRLTKYLLLTGFLLCTTLVANPLADSVDLGNGDYQSEWFGQYNKTHYPWIYHRDLGWMYVHAMPGDSDLYSDSLHRKFLDRDHVSGSR